PAGDGRHRVLRAGLDVDARALAAGHVARLAGAEARAVAAHAVDAEVAPAIGAAVRARLSVRLLVHRAGAAAAAVLVRRVAGRRRAVILEPDRDGRARPLGAGVV